MSTGTSAQAALTQGHQSTKEPDASQHSALFYLFQEVSKLTSPIHSTFVDTDSPCPWLKDAALQGSFSAEEAEEASSFETSDYSGSPQGASHNQTDVKEPNERSKMTPEGHSPWKVLNLINLQCKRLLHHRDADESEPNSLCSSSQSRIDQLKAAAKLMNQEAEGDCSSSQFTFQPFVLKHEREEIPSRVATEEAIISTGVGSSPQLCVKESIVSSLQSQNAGKSQTVFMKDTASGSSPSHPEDKKEDGRNKQSERNGEQREEYFTSEEATEHLTSENVSRITKPTPNQFLNTHQSYSSNGGAVIFLMKPELKLDCNANLSLLIEATNDPQLQSLHISRPLSPAAAHPCIITEEGHPLVERGVSHQEVTGALPGHQKTPVSNAQAPKRGENQKPELGPVQKEDAAPPAAQPWRTKTPRKQPRPSRSVDIHDPDLQGVMFRMDPELDDSREQCRLLITSEYR